MNQPPHDYFYGREAEQFTFYRLPKALFTNERYKVLSGDAKILYGLMLDRMSLSLRNDWIDAENRAFIYFTLDTAQEQMNCGHNKGVKMMSELEKVGLIERKKQGLGKPAIIYVKKFQANSEPETPPQGNNSSENSQGNTDFLFAEPQTSDFGKSRLPLFGSADFPNEEANKNDINNTESSQNNPIQSYPEQAPEEKAKNGLDLDEMDVRLTYQNIIKRNIEYDILSQQYGSERMDEVVELMADTVCSKRETITIASDDYPKEVIKSRFLKLTSFHIEYVFNCIDKNTSKVYNVKKYLLAALYNAPTTMDSYYRAEVNHDMYGGG